jgi:hypothetical protein
MVSALKYVRAPIPVPGNPIQGHSNGQSDALLRATGVDPHHPGNYTGAGLEVYSPAVLSGGKSP